MSGLDSRVVALTRLRVVNYCQVSSLALLVYEWARSLPEEAEYIWKPRKWNVASLFYIFSRYSPFIDTPLMLIYYVVPGVSEQTCSRIYYTATVSETIGMVTSELVMVLRTYALYGRSKKVLYSLSGTAATFGAVTFGLLVVFLRSFVFGPTLYEGVSGCNLVDASPIILGAFMCLLVFEILIVGMTVRKGLHNFRSSSGPLVATLYRDGVMFFVCMACLSLGVILISATAPQEYLDLLSQLTRVLHSVICARIILNLRSAAAARGPLGDGRTRASEGTLPSMRFRPRSAPAGGSGSDGEWTGVGAGTGAETGTRAETEGGGCAGCAGCADALDGTTATLGSSVTVRTSMAGERDGSSAQSA